MASIDVTAYGTDYITVKVSGLSTNAAHIEFYIDGNLDKHYTLSGTSKSHKYTGLEPDTEYRLSAIVYNSNWEVLTFKNNYVDWSTKSAATVTVRYYDGDHSWSKSSTSVTIDGPYRTDWDFVGWATSTKTTSVSSTYTEGAVIKAGSSNKSISLYAVYENSTTIHCYYITASTGALNSNTRTKIQYRVNISTSASSTDYYNSITLPTFTTSNSTITTSKPDRTWSVLGWHTTTSATSPKYDIGQSVTSKSITGDLYAVYSNECSITYNSNGGSGSMTKQTGTGYYNAYGNYKGATFSIMNCSFTPPTGKAFDSWNTKSDGSGTEYSAGGTETTSYNVIFYAIWVKARPSNWAWTTTGISKGSDMNYSQSGTTITPKPLTAKEWLAFMNRVKEFYMYKGKTVDSTYWNRAVNGVESGKPMTYTQANGARYLINQLNPPTSVPASVSPRTVITAAFINGLKNSLNSIV